MAFYDDLRLVEEFIYRNTPGEIYRAVKGGHCEKCDLSHEPKKRTCDSCGDEIFPREVYRVYIEGQDLDVDCDTFDEAKEFARMWIDSMLDDPPQKDDESPPEKALIPRPPPIPALPPPPKKGNRNRRGRRAENESSAKGSKGRLLAEIKMLGWGKRAAAIMRAARR